MVVFSVRWAVAGALAAALGCGGGGGPVDTGYGADQTPPATPNCADFCSRSADCLVDLCDEDTMSTNYAALRSTVEDSCNGTCTDAMLRAVASPESWTCFFKSSCRQAFGEDVCHTNAKYSCN